MSYFGPKKVKLDPNWLIEPTCTEIWYEKVLDLSYLFPIWPSLDPHLSGLCEIACAGYPFDIWFHVNCILLCCYLLCIDIRLVLVKHIGIKLGRYYLCLFSDQLVCIIFRFKVTWYTLICELVGFSFHCLLLIWTCVVVCLLIIWRRDVYCLFRSRWLALRDCPSRTTNWREKSLTLSSWLTCMVMRMITQG